MCLYPKLIRNRKYLENAKNGGDIPPVKDIRVLHVPIGCGKCIECRKQKARGWQIRLLEDIKRHTNGKFITLTLSNESIWEITNQLENKQATGYDLDNEIATKAVRLFLERWRKEFKRSLRHWFVTELGHKGTENIHLHGIVWTNESFEKIKEKWTYGFIWPRKEEYKSNYVNAATVNYIIKYVTKVDEDHKYYKSIILTSPGIGRDYVYSVNAQSNKFNESKTIETYRTGTGHKIAMPIYWRNKIYNDDEREALWLHRLDKNERWICGEKIQADNNTMYWSLLKYHRERSKKLGYGDDKIEWDRQAYELERRKLMQQKRVSAFGPKLNTGIQIKKGDAGTLEQFQAFRNWESPAEWTAKLFIDEQFITEL